MIIWLEDTFGADNAVTIFWVGVALLALIVLLILWMIIRRVRNGVYVAGGRNRKARLAIMDATKVDDHRHLILIRRDDVEHLLLIGGNSDLVVEADIRPTRASVATIGLEEIARQQARPEPERTQPVLMAEDDYAPAPEIAPTLASRPVQTNLAPAPAPAAPPPPRPAPPPVAVRPPTPPAPRPAPAPVVAPPTPPAPASVQSELDDDLMRELQSALDLDAPAPPRPAATSVAAPRPRPTLDDEMARLLGELSTQKR